MSSELFKFVIYFETLRLVSALLTHKDAKHASIFLLVYCLGGTFVKWLEEELFGIESFADTTMKAGKLSSNTIYTSMRVLTLFVVDTLNFVSWTQNKTKQFLLLWNHMFINRAAKLDMVILFQTQESAWKMSKMSPALGTRFTV